MAVIPPTEQVAVSSLEVLDRRRSERPPNASPELIALLRFRPESGASKVAEAHQIAGPCSGEDDEDQIGAARGIAIGLLLVAPFWIALGWFLR